MLNVTDIKNVKFSNSMNGYKKEEVEILLDKVEVDYSRYERVITERDAKIKELENEIETLKSSQDSIQTVLLSAQRLADEIVAEAKQKSEQIIKDAENSIAMITEREKQLTVAFEQKASERKNAFEKEMEQAISEANSRKQVVEKAAVESVERQQMLFDKLRQEVGEFKAEITAKYREHLELLARIPDAVPIEPAKASKIALEQYEKQSFTLEEAESTDNSDDTNDIEE